MAGGAGFEREGALAGGGADLVGREAGVDGFGAAEAVEAGGGEDEGITLAFGELAQAGVDVAANLDEADVGTEGEELGAATRAGGADGAVEGQRVQSPVGLADPDVAGVDPGRDGGQGELRGQGGGEILERVHGEVDAALGEGLFDLLDEDAFAVDDRGGRDEAGLLHAVAGGADDFDLGGVAGGLEGGEDVVRLPEGELRSARANADGSSAGEVSGHDLFRIPEAGRECLGSGDGVEGEAARDGLGGTGALRWLGMTAKIKNGKNKGNG